MTLSKSIRRRAWRRAWRALTGRAVTHLLLLFIVAVWTAPTLGLLVSSFRDKEQLILPGWWSAFRSAVQYEAARTGGADEQVVINGRYVISGNLLEEKGAGRILAFGDRAMTPDAYRAGETVTLNDGARFTVDADGSYRWESAQPYPQKRGKRIYFAVKVPPAFTLANYREVLSARGIEITKLHQQMGGTMIYVTHDQVEAMTLADRIAVVNKGSIEQFGTPLDLYHRPRNTFVAGFIGSPAINLLEGKISAVADATVTMALAGGGSAQCQALLSDSALNQPVTVGIRPEALTPATEASATISGRVQLVEELGEFHLIYITTAGGDTVIAKVEGTAAVKADDTIHLMAPLEKIHLFDEQGRSLQV